MERDIVQFIPFNEFRYDARNLNMQVLEEIPKQLLSYFSMRKINPNPKKVENNLNNLNAIEI